ncbi:hypothetical protein F4806DRAFT_462034 [Annulohypoxylon nitens]|nr:hypothetical protein F4806DRAFT_462034 [Annulohypoxylon nitens]
MYLAGQAVAVAIYLHLQLLFSRVKSRYGTEARPDIIAWSSTASGSRGSYELLAGIQWAFSTQPAMPQKMEHRRHLYICYACVDFTIYTSSLVMA